MHLRSTFTSLVGILGLALAEDVATTTDSSSATATSSSAITTHTVYVGQNSGHSMVPNITYAAVGDVVKWFFFPTGHSVIQGVYEQACIPVNLAYPGQTGFWSGTLNATTVDINNVPTYQVTINDTEPIFYYCGAENSCTGNHMVGAINPNKTEDFTYQHYYDLSVEATVQLTPTDSWPSEADPTSTSSSSTSSSGSSSSSSSNSTSSHGLSSGAIAGIVIGALAVLFISAILLYFCGRRGGVAWAQKRYWPWGGAQTGPSVNTISSDMPPSKTVTPAFTSAPTSPAFAESQNVSPPLGYHPSMNYGQAPVPQGQVWPGFAGYPQQHPLQMYPAYPQMAQTPGYPPVSIPVEAVGPVAPVEMEAGILSGVESPKAASEIDVGKPDQDSSSGSSQEVRREASPGQAL